MSFQGRIKVKADKAMQCSRAQNLKSEDLIPELWSLINMDEPDQKFIFMWAFDARKPTFCNDFFSLMKANLIQCRSHL